MPIVYIDIAATLFSLTLVVFFVPESIPIKQSAHIRKLYEAALKAAGASDPSMTKKAKEVEKAAWYSHFFRSMAFFHSRGKNINLILLGAISFLQTLALKGTFSVLILYTFQLFNWTNLEVGALFTLGSFVRLFSLLVILPILVHAYHKRAAKKNARSASSAAYNQPSRDETEQDINNNNNSNNNTNIYVNNDRIDGFSGMEDPVVASSLEHLGEAVLNLSDDEESFQERRRRQSTVDSAVTWNTDRTRTNTRSSSSSPPSPSSTSPKNKKSSISPRTREQVMSDLKLDTWVIRLGFIVNSVTYIGYGLATQSWMFFLASALHATSIIASPSLKTLLTSMVEPSEFGAALGAIQVLESIAGIFSPIVISWVYATTVKTRPDLVWYCCALLTGACTVLSFMIRQKQFVKGPGQASA